MLTNDVVSFEQPGPELLPELLIVYIMTADNAQTTNSANTDYDLHFYRLFIYFFSPRKWLQK